MKTKLIKEIKLQQEDIDALEKIDKLGVTPSKLTEFDFHDIVVIKPWGYEYMAYEDESKTICAWVLHMKNNGTGTSIHCHRTKITLITVIKGKIWVKTLKEKFILSAGDEMWIDRATFHAMGALEDNTILTEIESPSFKPDAIRLKDRWGRERQEYEAQCKLSHIYKMDCSYRTHKRKNDLIKDLVRRARVRWNI
jgi:mannose-6-phosphate isomerase-like protein (cupin superfamily)